MYLACFQCGKVGRIKQSKYSSTGYFCKCSCGYSSDPGEIVDKLNVLKKRCPMCHKMVVLKSSDEGKCFFGCYDFPKCDFSTDLYGVKKLGEYVGDNDPRLYKGNTCVYVVKSGDYVKIGKSSNIRERFKTLRNNTPLGIDKKAYVKIEDKNINEAILHEKFKEHRVNGEWFACSSEVVRYVKENGFKTVPTYSK